MKRYMLSIFRQTETHRPRRAREGDGKTCARSTRRYAPLALGCSRAAARAEHGDRAQSLLAGPTLRVVIIAADLGCAIADPRYRVHRGSRYKGLPARPGLGRRRVGDRASRLISLLGISVRVRKPRLRLRPRLLVQPVARVGADDVAPEAGLVGAAGLGWSRRGRWVAGDSARGRITGTHGSPPSITPT
jgi:hypothetical protein